MATYPTVNPSGTWAFFPAYGDFVLEAFDRIQKRASSLTQAELVSAYRSINLALSTWNNYAGPNLWTRELNTIQLTAGQPTYNLPSNTIQMLDVYIRQYPMSGAVDLTLDFTTVLSSALVTIGWPAHGLIVGNYVNIVVPVSVGGLILLGFYTVTSVPSGNSIIITAASAATASASPGVVPLFTATASSTTVTVTLPAHGLTAGETFNVQVPTIVSDVNLYGSYIIATVLTANTFTITGPNAAFAGASVYENTGEAFVAGQSSSGQPNDRILYPISETDYASIPTKLQEGLPTCYFYNRQSPVPTVTLWLVPGSTTGPFTLQYWYTRQIQDANLGGGQTPDVPYRFFEPLCADVAARLAQKFAPDKWMSLKEDAAMQWKIAADADTEKASLYIAPDLSGYDG